MVVLALAVILIASSLTTPPNAEHAKPQLRVVTLRPFEVVGTGFRAGETVRLSVRAETGAATARDVAGRRGGIDVRFARLKLDSCPEYIVSASGNKGSRTSVRSIPRTCGIDPGPSR